MTQPVGYDEDGNPRFKIKDRDDDLDARYEEHARRVEEERMKRRWDFGRMFKNAVEWIKRNPGK